MKKLYSKSEIWFAIIWIIIYVVGTSIAENVSTEIGFGKSVTLGFHLALCIVLLVWLKNNGLFRKYGICRSGVPASRFLYYVPLLIIMSCNLWLGVTMNYDMAESLIFAASMACVGFLEEVIFRGLLFRAMAKDSIKAAIIVSSITFGIGHIVNMFNGSGMDPLANICQIIYAMAIGFLFVVIFYRGGSLWPCIITHSVVNALSVFSDESGMTDTIRIITALILTIVPIVYTLILMKSLPRQEQQKEV